MRERTRTTAFVAIAGLVIAASADAWAAPARDVTGTVIGQQARWGHAGGTIVTESTVETRRGERVRVLQLGGRVGDIAMRVTHAPPRPPLGARVTMRLTEATSADGRTHHVLRELVSMAPPSPGVSSFVQTTTDDQSATLFWESGCAQVALHDAGAAAIPAATEIDAIVDSVTEWTSNIDSCSPFDLRYSGTTPIEPTFDGFNVIRFREDRWCRPAAGNDPEVCHDPAAAGLTFLTFAISGDRAGAILDADIELNGVDFGLLYNNTGDTGSPCGSDIPNTLVHELGHFLGLDHTCWDGRGPRPVDNDGTPAPSCAQGNQLPPAIRDATMFAFQDCDETSKATLEADDVAGVCAIYPDSGSDDPGECLYPDIEAGGFCAAADTGGASGWALVLAVLAFSCRRRRARRRHRAGTSRGAARAP